MKILNIIDKIYESSHFGTYLIISILVLIILFIIVFILGIRDSMKSKRVKLEVEEDVKDITFNIPSELENIKEDVTFEMPSLTQNLENFKKSLEEEIQKEEMAEVRKTSGLILPKEKKTVKVLDLEKIEDTSILPIKSGVAKNNIEVYNNQELPKLASEKDKKNVLEEKIFNNKEKVEIPVMKEKVLATKEKTNENVVVNDMEVLEEEPVDNKILNSKVEVQRGQESVKTSQSGMYSMDDDF